MGHLSKEAGHTNRKQMDILELKSRGTNSSIQSGGTGEGEANASFSASCCQPSDHYIGDLSEREANTEGAWKRGK